MTKSRKIDTISAISCEGVLAINSPCMTVSNDCIVISNGLNITNATELINKRFSNAAR
ncbi:Uncharacterised protein [BD1-7 clade bacterium]|nr:Uncharacterised protein [BD1-7 clade bacterium]